MVNKSNNRLIPRFPTLKSFPTKYLYRRILYAEAKTPIHRTENNPRPVITRLVVGGYVRRGDRAEVQSNLIGK